MYVLDTMLPCNECNLSHIHMYHTRTLYAHPVYTQGLTYLVETPNDRLYSMPTQGTAKER